MGDTTLHVSSGSVGGATVVVVSGAAEQKSGDAGVSAPYSRYIWKRAT